MKERKIKKGFTILEILVVVSVIAILIGIAVPRFKGMQDEANIIKARSELKTVQAAMESYRNQNGAYAETLAALEGATPQIISAGMTDPLSQDAYVVTRDAGGLYYVIIANGVNGANDTTISGDAVTKGADDYCVTNGSGC